MYYAEVKRQSVFLVTQGGFFLILGHRSSNDDPNDGVLRSISSYRAPGEITGITSVVSQVETWSAKAKLESW